MSLGSAGYTTCQIGKWHVGEPGTPGMPHLQGFEHSLCFDHEKNKRAQYIYPTRLWRNGVAEEIPENKGFHIGHPDNRFDKEGRFVPGGMPNPSAMRVLRRYLHGRGDQVSAHASHETILHVLCFDADARGVAERNCAN